MTQSHLTLNDVRPYDKNAKKHPNSQLESLADIVKLVGWRIPALVNQQGTLIAGHGRWMAFKMFQESHGLKPIWVIDDTGKTVSGEAETTPMTPEQEEVYRLADNKLNESEWDMQMVKMIALGMSLPMLDLTGFGREIVLKNDDKDDQVPETPAIPKSKVGDIYDLGQNRIICGDSLSAEVYATLLGDRKADMVFTDPPYNINYTGGGKRTSTKILNDKMSDVQFQTFLTKAFEPVRASIKAGAALYVFHSPTTQKEFEDAMEANGLEICTQLIWNKPSAGLGMGDYRAKHEPFFYANVKGTKPHFYGDRTNTSVLDFQKTDAQLASWAKKERELAKAGKTTIWTMKREPMQEYVHPTQKPVELIVYALQNSSKVEDIVLDPFMGSGSTLIACQKTNRVAFGIELDPKFVDVIVQRWVNYTENRNIIKNGQPIVW